MQNIFIASKCVSVMCRHNHSTVIQIHSPFTFLTLVLFDHLKKLLLHQNGTKLGDFYGSHYVTTKQIVDLIRKS